MHAPPAPDSPPQERKKLLSFVVVGGGPTGVEVAAEMHDMIQDDLSRLYPDLIKDVQVRSSMDPTYMGDMRGPCAHGLPCAPGIAMRT